MTQGKLFMHGPSGGAARSEDRLHRFRLWRHVPEVAELLPSRRVEQAEMRQVLRRALGDLDPQMRAVLVLRDMQEMEYQLISEVLGVPIGTVKSRLFRARLALRQAAESSLGGPPADHERQPLPGAHQRGPGK